MATLSIKRPKAVQAQLPEPEMQSVSNLFLANQNLADGLALLLEEKIFDPSVPSVKEFESYCYSIIRKCFDSNYARNYFPLDPAEVRNVLISAIDSQTAEFRQTELVKGQSSSYIILGQSFLARHIRSEDMLAAVLVHECLHLWRRKANLSWSNSKPEEAKCNIQCMHILYHAGYNHMAIHDLFANFGKSDTDVMVIFDCHIESKRMARILKDESGLMNAARRSETELSHKAQDLKYLHYEPVFYSAPNHSFFSNHGWWYLSGVKDQIGEALKVAKNTVDLLCSDKIKNNYYLFWKAMSTLAHIKETVFKDYARSNLWRGNDSLKDLETIAEHYIRLEDFVRENKEELSAKNFRPETISEKEYAHQDFYENYRYVFDVQFGANQLIRNKFHEFIEHKSKANLALLAEEITDFMLARPDYEFSMTIKLWEFLGAYKSNLEYDHSTETIKIKNPASRFQQAIKLYLELQKSQPEKAGKLAYLLKLLKTEKYHPELELNSPEFDLKISINLEEPELLFSYDSSYNLIKVQRKTENKKITLAEAIESLPDLQRDFFRNFIDKGYCESNLGDSGNARIYEKELWQKHRSTKYNTDWSELKTDWKKFFLKHIREISCPLFDARPTDWQLRFCSEVELLFKSCPDQVKKITDFFIENNLFIPRILFECKDHQLRSELVSRAKNENSIKFRIGAENFNLLSTARLYYSLYDRDLRTDFNPTFRNYIIRFFMTSPQIDWNTKDWFYLRSAKRYCNDSYRYHARYNRGIRLTTRRAQILFDYKTPQSITETFELFNPAETFRSMGMPISQELTLLESERLLISGVQEAKSANLVQVLEFAYRLFPTKRIEQLEQHARKLAIKNFESAYYNAEELIAEYFNQKKLTLKLNHLTINQIYDYEEKILLAIENIKEPVKRLDALDFLLLDKNAQLSDGHYSKRILPSKKLYSAVVMDQIAELYARTFAEIHGNDNKSADYSELALAKIRQIIIQSTCPRNLADSLLISVNAQESLCIEAELMLRNVFINTHLYEEIALELLIDQLSRDPYSIKATRKFLTSPLSTDSRKVFIAALEDSRKSFFNSITEKSERVLQNSDEDNFNKLLAQKSRSHLLELASAFYLTFWSFGIKERAFVLDKIIVPASLDADFTGRAKIISQNYLIAKHNFFDDSADSKIISQITDGYFEALNQLGSHKTEKARLLVSALMVARNPMMPAANLMQSCSQVISACFFEIGDKLMQCLDSAGFSFPDSKYKASPLGQIASWQLLRSRNIKIEHLHERLGSGGAALVYRITKEGQDLALRIQREGIQQKADDYINELKLTARILSIKDSKYNLANEIVSTLELAINKEIRPANWGSQIDLHATHYNNKTYYLEDGRKIIFRAPRITELNTEQAYFTSEIAEGTEVIALRNIIDDRELREICSYQIITDLSAELSGLASCNDRHAGQVKLQRDGNNFILWQLDPVGFELRHPSQHELQFLGRILSRSINLPTLISKGASGFFDLIERESDREINNPLNPQEIINFLKLRRLGWHARKDFIQHVNFGDLMGQLSSLTLHPEISKQLNNWQRTFLKR